MGSGDAFFVTTSSRPARAVPDEAARGEALGGAWIGA